MKSSPTLLARLFLLGATVFLGTEIDSLANGSRNPAPGNGTEIAMPRAALRQGQEVTQPLIAKQSTSPSAPLTSASLVGSPVTLFNVRKLKDYGGVCNGATFYFDGPLSPVSYQTGSSTTVSVIGAVATANQQVVGTVTGSGSSASISTLASPNQCVPSFVSAFSNDSESFTWGEWLYGTFFNAATQKMYSTIYNEYYGPNGYNNHQGWYSADGLAVSTDFGRTFSRIATPPGHVIARPTFLFMPGSTTDQIGYGGLVSILLSPKDNYFYAFTTYSNPPPNVFGVNVLMRTDNLDDPTSWRVWDGNGFNGSFFPPNQPPGYDCLTNVPVTVGPMYLGWNQYFQRFIAIGGTNDNGWGYALSDDLIHWDDAVKIMDPPSGDAFYGYPSLVDPSMLLNTSDSRAASNNYSGQTPYLTYIHNDTSYNTSIPRQQVKMQQISFSGGSGPLPPPALQNISIRGTVGPGDQALIAGFQIIGPGNPKTILIRGMGPSLGGGLNTPTISLYDGSGTLIASNTGWRNNSSTNLALLNVVAPGNVGDSALAYGNFTPGAYSIVLSGGSGIGQIELYDVTLQSSDPALNSKLAAFSARGYVQGGAGAMTMGFIVSQSRQAILRATSLSTLPLSPVLADPFLTLYGGGTTIASNDNWQTDPNQAVISGYGVAPGNSYESAMLPTVGPGGFTASVSGHSNAPDGYALVEFFDVTP